MWSASIPYSTHVPSSSRTSSRSRTVSLPSACWRSTRSGPPMSRARSRRSFSSPTSGPQSWTSPPPVVVTPSCLHGEDLPFAGDAFELVAAAVGELDVGPLHQVAHRARDQHLARTGKARDPRSDVHCDPGEVVATQLALAGVDAGADFQADVAGILGDGAGAFDGPSGPVEGGEEAVAGGVHLLAAKASELTADHVVVGVEQLLPAPVAESGRLFGRPDDVGEQHGLQHAVDVDLGFVAATGQELLDDVERVLLAARSAIEMPFAGELHESSVGNVVGQVPATSHRHDPIAGPVEDEGGSRDRGEHAPNVDLDVAP